jgi:hypothetical protein
MLVIPSPPFGLGKVTLSHAIRQCPLEYMSFGSAPEKSSYNFCYRLDDPFW